MVTLPVYLEHDVTRLPCVGVVVERRPCRQLGDVVVDGELEQQQLLQAHLLKDRARGSGLGAWGLGLGAWGLGSGLGLEAKEFDAGAQGLLGSGFISSRPTLPLASASSTRKSLDTCSAV